jgi:hypothetical protein
MVPGVGTLPIGDAANGLCGGMVFAARDCFEAHRTPPTDPMTPAAGTPAFNFLVRRLLDSLDLPAGPLRYYDWMKAADEDVASRTRAEIAIAQASLDGGELCPLGLVRARSIDPRDLGKNHQVLAFGYDLDASPDRVTFHVYDPNHPGSDTTISCSLTGGAALDLVYSTGEPTRGFFVTPYSRADPAPLFGAPSSPLSWIGSIERVFRRLFGGGG